MSIETWMKEFYDLPACNVPEDKAIAYSLKKWIGLRKENLELHGVYFDGYTVEESKDPTKHRLTIDGDSCALCEHYYDSCSDIYDADDEQVNCHSCPLYLARGGVPCDSERDDEQRSPYFAMVGEGESNKNNPRNPEPMIYWLIQAQLKEEKE